MDGQFFLSWQQDIKIFLYPPILCAIFRAIFIAVYNPYDSLDGHWPSLRGAFRYGFWWGMDFNAYVFLLPFLFITIGGLFFPVLYDIGDTLRLAALVVYCAVIYAAFAGKMIFYRHFHDIYNYMVHYGKNAEKHNLIDVFFNQDRGALVLVGFIPVIAISTLAGHLFLSLPTIAPPGIAIAWPRTFNGILFVLSVLAFYWFRYGGTFSHDDKPEWDTIPTVVKEDLFFAKATVDDLVSLELVWKHPLREEYTKSDEELKGAVANLLPQGTNIEDFSNPLLAFKRTAQGERIQKPKHIFLIVGESIPQWSLDDIYRPLHVCDGLWRFKEDEHTAQIVDFLPAGNVSRPSIVSLMSGVYDAAMELNEREAFWRQPLPTSFPAQMKRLGYDTVYWYGGNASYGNFNHFGKAQGFDRVESASVFCGPRAPKTWVGVYDHVFLEKVAELIGETDRPTFHFIYTTSNHGPYKMEKELLDYDPEKVMPDVGDDLKKDKERNKELATYRYSDKAIFNFVDEMKKRYPQSLFIITGDHSNLFGNLRNTSLIHRDYTLRDTYQTVCLFQHPQIHKNFFTAVRGSHMSIMPTIIEAIAPKGFTYYSLEPSLFETSPRAVITPYQWMDDMYTGDVRQQYAEPTKPSAEPVAKAERTHTHEMYEKTAKDKALLTTWLIKHEDELFPKSFDEI